MAWLPDDDRRHRDPQERVARYERADSPGQPAIPVESDAL